MKKSYYHCLIFKLIAFTTLLICSIVINSCRKDDNAAATSPDNDAALIDKAKRWYNQQIKTDKHIDKASPVILHRMHPQALPNWDAYTITQTGTGERLIIVKTQGPEVENPKVDLTSSLVFTYRNGSIVSGNRVEAIGDPTYIKAQGMQLISKYKDRTVPGFSSGVFILYDINHNPLESHTLLNGRMDNGTAAVIMQIPKSLQKNLSALSGKKLSSINGLRDTLPPAKMPQTGKTAQTTTSIRVCTDWFLVTTNAATGEILSEKYLYTTCITYNDGGGGGGGSGGNGIFGLNNSNAQVADINFDNLLAYAESQGMLFSDPVDEQFTYNGVTYYGQMTFIYDSTGHNQVAVYFSPDSSTNLFQTGYEYNMGNGLPGGETGSIDDGGTFNVPYVTGHVTIPHPSGGVAGGSGSGTSVGAFLAPGSVDEDEDNNTVGGYDNTVYPSYQQTTPWPTVANIINPNQFVGWVGGANCLERAKQQIAQSGYAISNYDAPGQTIQVYTETTGINLANSKLAVGYLNIVLPKGIPVIVGVDAATSTSTTTVTKGNLKTDASTDHFIVIVGMGTDSKGNFYRFYDSSTSDLWAGTSNNNKLYYNSTTGMIIGNTDSKYDNAATQLSYSYMHPYILTQLRKSKKK